MSAPSTACEVIAEVGDLLSDRERWTQGYLARDGFGSRADPNSEEAVCWCLYGAVAKVCDIDTYADDLFDTKARPVPPQAIEAVDRLKVASRGHGGIVAANDGGGYEAVQRVIGAALEGCS